MPLANRVYTIHWHTRDLGYGSEEGFGEYVYRGMIASGSHRWQPLDGSPSLYLFPDEVLSIGEM